MWSSVPGAGRYRFAATMDKEGSWAMVYAPLGRTFSVDSKMLTGKKLTAWWYSPRTGKAKKIGRFTNDGSAMMFTPPAVGEALDWVLVIDDAVKKYPKPEKKIIR